MSRSRVTARLTVSLLGSAPARFNRLGRLMTGWLGLILGLAVGAGTAWAQEEIFLANPNENSITVYPRTASGNAAPLRTITGLPDPFDLVVDTANNELVVTNFGNNSITVFASTASGNAARSGP